MKLPKTPTVMSQKRRKHTAQSLQKARAALAVRNNVLQRASRTIDLLKCHIGEELEGPAVRLLLIFSLQLYKEAVHTTEGPLGDVALHAQVFSKVATYLHMSERTVSSAFQCWQEQVLTAHDRPLAESVVKLLSHLTTFTPRGPKPLPSWAHNETHSPTN